MKNTAVTKTNKKAGFFRKLVTGASVCSTMAAMTATTALAGNFGEDVQLTAGSDANATDLMGKIIGILLTITRFVGIALVVYGVYEVVMSFMQNQPEAKTKGIIMALAGVVMIALKSILQGVGIVA